MRLSQQAVADALGITPAGYGHWETGRTSITVENLTRVAKILGVTVSYFFEAEDVRSSRFGDHVPSDFTYEVTDREMDELTSSIAGVPPEVRPVALAAFKAIAKSLAENKEPRTYGQGKGARTVIDPDIDGIEEGSAE